MRNKKLYKRLVALILAGCVVVGSSAVGFAADTEEAAARLKHYHIWILGTKISDATCTSPAIYNYSCRCGETKTDEFGLKNPYQSRPYRSSQCRRCHLYRKRLYR